MSRTIVPWLLGSTLLTLPACSKTDPAPSASPTPVSHARPMNPAEFRLKAIYTDVEAGTSLTAEFVFRAGRTYYLLGETSEVIVIDPEQKTVRFLDLRRHAVADLKFAQIEMLLERYRQARAREIAADLKLDTRAAKLEAVMRGDLLDPHFHVEGVQTSHRLSLTNRTVDVNVSGETETDLNRRNRIAEALTLTTQLRALRFSDAIAPFANLEAIRELLSERQLRPTEMTFLFRLNGPPEKYRWRFIYAPTLTDREWEALRRIDKLLIKTKNLPFDRYERLIQRVDRESSP